MWKIYEQILSCKCANWLCMHSVSKYAIEINYYWYILKWNNSDLISNVSTQFVFTIQIILNVSIALKNGHQKNLACNTKQWCNAVAMRTPKLIDWVPYKLFCNNDSLVSRHINFFANIKPFIYLRHTIGQDCQVTVISMASLADALFWWTMLN